jgi:ubiquinone biosynthesis monooxygenase Coq7
VGPREKHLAVMDKLQVQHSIRPTIVSDVAKVAGFGLGAATALLGKEVAMACTEVNIMTSVFLNYSKSPR